VVRTGCGGGREVLRLHLPGLQGGPGFDADERFAQRPSRLLQVVDFTLLGQRFQALSAGPHHEFNDAISIVVQCDDQTELDRYWNALLEGGGRPQACGWLIDRYGLRWQIVPALLGELMRDGDHARSKRVTDAMLKMVKLDIAALEEAYRS
jgi:predicted 3-demethylubiquinone-9 3-methyltransferase (glyoxalase superfamily)